MTKAFLFQVALISNIKWREDYVSSEMSTNVAKESSSGLNLNVFNLSPLQALFVMTDGLSVHLADLSDDASITCHKNCISRYVSPLA